MKSHHTFPYCCSSTWNLFRFWLTVSQGKLWFTTSSAMFKEYFHLCLHVHLENKNSHIRILFVDFSSAFNTISPMNLTGKRITLGFTTALCNWILDFLTSRPQRVWTGSHTSSAVVLNAEKGANDTAIIGCIIKNNESSTDRTWPQFMWFCLLNKALHLEYHILSSLLSDPWRYTNWPQ